MEDIKSWLESVDETQKTEYENKYRDMFNTSCIGNNLDMVRIVYEYSLEAGIDLYLSDGSTIMSCFSNGSYDTVKYLISVGSPIPSIWVLSVSYHII